MSARRERKAARVEARESFLKAVGSLRKGWTHVPTRKLLRRRQVVSR